MTTDRPATIVDLNAAVNATVAAAVGGGGLYQSLAIVGALAETRVLDPLIVARWAEFFATTLPKTTSEEAHAAMREGIAGFAMAIRSMATVPTGAGRA